LSPSAARRDDPTASTWRDRPLPSTRWSRRLAAVIADLSDQIGVLVVHASSPTFTSVLEASSLIDSVGQDFGVKMYAGDAPEPSSDPMEPLLTLPASRR